MNKDFKIQLDSELKSHVTQVSERKREEEWWRAREDELHDAFKYKCRTIVLPIYKQFSKHVKLSGWNSKIYYSEDKMLIPTDNGWKEQADPITFAMIRSWRGEENSDELRNDPYFVLVCNYRNSDMFFHYSMMSAEKVKFDYCRNWIKLTDLTRREIRDHLAFYFAQLLKFAEED